MKRSSWSLFGVWSALVDSSSFFLLVAQSDIPLRSLSSSFIRLGLLGLLAQPCSTIRVLFAHGLPVRQVLRAVDDNDQRPYLWPVDSHVRVYSCRVHSAAHCCNVWKNGRHGERGD